MNRPDPLLAPLPDADHREFGGVQLDMVAAGAARVRRIVYAPGFRWSKDIKPMVGTESCKHAHVGFLARGRIGVQYGDGCVEEFVAPQVLVVEPGHDGWVMGDEPAVLIEFDFEKDTVEKLGLRGAHDHR